MVQRFNLEDFILRTTGKQYAESTLKKVLDTFPSLHFFNVWLAGGALRRTVSGQALDSDYDLFFRTQESKNEFVKQLKEAGFKNIKTTKHHEEYHKHDDKLGLIKVQCVFFKYFSDAEEVIDSFDYTICQFVTDLDEIWVGDYTLWDLARKKLAIHKISFPTATARRMLKYANQGFSACNGCIQSILTSVIDQPELRMQLDIEYVD